MDAPAPPSPPSASSNSRSVRARASCCAAGSGIAEGAPGACEVSLQSSPVMAGTRLLTKLGASPGALAAALGSWRVADVPSSDSESSNSPRTPGGAAGCRGCAVAPCGCDCECGLARGESMRAVSVLRISVLTVAS